MRFFVNCSNLTSGGGLTVGLGIVTSLLKLESDYFIVFLPNTKEYNIYQDTKNVRFLRNDTLLTLQKIFFEYRLARLCKKYKCDAVLSLSNYALPSKLPQSLMLHWPYAVYPEKEIWQKMSFFNYLKRKVRFIKMKYLMKYATTLIVQTQVMLQKVQKHLNFTGKIDIIPSASGFQGSDVSKQVALIIDQIKEKDKKVFLCINEYYEHKNLEILIPVAQKIKSKNLNISLVITLEENKNSKKILNLIRKYKLQDILINVGRVKRSETKALYESCDALFFPSLIESFGIPLVEAQETNLPIYASDRDFAHVLCVDNAIYFDPLNPDDIIEKIIQPIKVENPSVIHSWDDIFKEMLNTLK